MASAERLLATEAPDAGDLERDDDLALEEPEALDERTGPVERERTMGGARARPEPTDEGGDDVFAQLTADHRRVAELFDEILSDPTGTLTKQRKNVELVLTELERHAKLEEALFYPPVKAKAKRDSEDRQHVNEALEEHGAMKDLMKKIKRSDGRDEMLRAKVQVLKEIVEHHVEEEEHGLFDEARRLLGARKLEQIGEETAQVRQRAERRRAPGKRAPAKGRAAKSRAPKGEPAVKQGGRAAKRRGRPPAGGRRKG